MKVKNKALGKTAQSNPLTFRVRLPALRAIGLSWKLRITDRLRLPICLRN
jgi:hypothetical protein